MTAVITRIATTSRPRMLHAHDHLERVADPVDVSVEGLVDRIEGEAMGDDRRRIEFAGADAVQVQGTGVFDDSLISPRNIE